LLDGDLLHVLIAVRKTSIFQVVVASLLDQTLQFDGISPILLTLFEIGKGLLDHHPLLARTELFGG